MATNRNRPRTPIKNRRERQTKKGGGRTTVVIGLLLVFSAMGVVAFLTPFVLAGAAYAYAADAPASNGFSTTPCSYAARIASVREPTSSFR